MDVPLERFDVLLRELLSFGLAERGDDGRWHFTAGVDDRLTALAASQRPAERPVLRFGTACAACHALRPTRPHGGRHLCDDCIRRVAQPAWGAGESPEAGPFTGEVGVDVVGHADVVDDGPSAADDVPGTGGPPAGRRLVSHYRAPAAWVDRPG